MSTNAHAFPTQQQQKPIRQGWLCHRQPCQHRVQALTCHIGTPWVALAALRLEGRCRQPRPRRVPTQQYVPWLRWMSPAFPACCAASRPHPEHLQCIMIMIMKMKMIMRTVMTMAIIIITINNRQAILARRHQVHAMQVNALQTTPSLQAW